MGTSPSPSLTNGESSTPLNWPTITPLPRGGVLQRWPAYSLTFLRTCALAVVTDGKATRAEAIKLIEAIETVMPERNMGFSLDPKLFN
ncbi:hypothetical protein D9M72_633190 [compost metagenome]